MTSNNLQCKFYTVKCTFTQKQVPKQNEKFTLVSTNKVSE